MNNKPVTINDQGIAWESDKEYKFKNGDGDWKAKQWHDVTDGKLLTPSLSIFNIVYRALHCVDENRWSPQFQEALGQN
jgi:hypothetical protein